MRVSLLTLSLATLTTIVASRSKADSFVEYKLKSVLEGSKFAENFDATHTPVIGIVTQTLEAEMHNDTKFEGWNTYIMKSYVDWVEAAGARVIPLINGEP